MVDPEWVKKPDASPGILGIEKSRALDDNSGSKSPFNAQAQQEKKKPIDFAFLENSPSNIVFPKPSGLAQPDDFVALDVDTPLADVAPKQSKKRRAMRSRGGRKHTTFMNDSIMEVDSLFGGGIMKESVVGVLNEPLPINILDGEVLSEHASRKNTPESRPKFTSLERITEEAGQTPMSPKTVEKPTINFNAEHFVSCEDLTPNDDDPHEHYAEPYSMIDVAPGIATSGHASANDAVGCKLPHFLSQNQSENKEVMSLMKAINLCHTARVISYSSGATDQFSTDFPEEKAGLYFCQKIGFSIESHIEAANDESYLYSILLRDKHSQREYTYDILAQNIMKDPENDYVISVLVSNCDNSNESTLYVRGNLESMIPKLS
jgi:hypothetical protein